MNSDWPNSTRRLRRLGVLAAALLLAVSWLAGPLPMSPAEARAAEAAAVAATSPASSTTTPSGSVSGPSAVPAYRQANRVAVLTVEGIIDKVTLASLERRVRRAVKDGADAVVFDIDTPGGEMYATFDICHLIRTECPANSVAWVNPRAFSAGTIMALACREIVVSPNATFGDAAMIQASPLTGLQPLPPAERAKMESPLVAEVIGAARRNHYDENLLLAFVRLGSGIWMLEHVQTGDRVFVNLEEYRAVFGEDPPRLTSMNAAALTAAAGPPNIRPLNQPLPVSSDQSSKSTTVDAEFDQSLPPTRDPLTAADRGQWKLLRQVVDDSTLLTLKPEEALYYGLATKIIANDGELKDFFGAKDIVRYDGSWSEDLVRFLSSFWVRAILIVIFLVGLFVELAAPGFGVFGGASLVALMLLIGAPALAGMAQWWDLVLIVGGLLLVAAELFLIPGTGIPGILGVLSLLVGLVATFITGDIGTSQGQSELWTGLLGTLMSVFVSGVVLWFLSRHLHSVPLLNRVILTAELKSPHSPAATGLLAAMGETRGLLNLGDQGTAQTDLRPAGKALFGDRLHDVQSSGGYIPRGTAVRIVSVGRAVIEVEEHT